MAQGARGYIAVKKELTWGQKETGDNDCYLPFISETLTANIEEVLSAAQRGILDEPKSYQGERSFGGDVVVEVHPASIGHILRSAINEPETTAPDGATNAKQHVFIPRQATDFHADCPINPYTFEVYRDQGDAFQFLGAIVNTLALNFSTTDKILKGTCGILAKNSGDTPKTVLSLETTDPFKWDQAVISIAESPNNDIESFGINYDNKCVGKYALNNTAILRKIIRDGFRTIPINFTIDFVDRTEYDKFKAGTEQAIQVKFVGVECEPGYNYTLQIDIPKFRYLTYPINISGPGPITCGVTGKAKYDASLGYPIKFTLINLETEY